jgi:hypothetical protein
MLRRKAPRKAFRQIVSKTLPPTGSLVLQGGLCLSKLGWLCKRRDAVADMLTLCLKYQKKVWQ